MFSYGKYTLKRAEAKLDEPSHFKTFTVHGHSNSLASPTVPVNKTSQIFVSGVLIQCRLFLRNIQDRRNNINNKMYEVLKSQAAKTSNRKNTKCKTKTNGWPTIPRGREQNDQHHCLEKEKRDIGNGSRTRLHTLCNAHAMLPDQNIS